MMDDADWDDWMKLTDEQQDEILRRETKAYFDWLNAMSTDELYVYRRRRWIKHCLNWRKHMRSLGFEFLRERLRVCQMEMVKLRHWRRTGIYPGEA